MVTNDLSKEPMSGDALSDHSAELGLLLQRLDAPDHHQVLEAVVQIRNLIIGNNKYKSFYLNDRLLGRLVDLLKESAGQLTSSAEHAELMHQIVIMFGSFALGTLVHVMKLVQHFQLHRFLFTFLGKLDDDQQRAPMPHRSRLLLIESILRCLSNMYTTAQIVPSIVYTLDCQLYGRQQSALGALLNLFALSSVTKQTVINIVAISAANFLVATSLSGATVHAKSKRCQRGRHRVSKFRSCLIQSSAIGQFATLLTSLQPCVQLSALKFYAAICFENYEASMAMLTYQYYNMPLVELLGAYLAGDNSVELQLYAAKCLTNLCRSTTGGRLAADSGTFAEAAVSSKASPAFVVDYSSPLIRQRTLTTLVHICHTCSTSHRYLVNGCGVSSVASHLVGPRLTRLTDTVAQSVNAFLLVQCLSTLAYLIELDSDLQEKASHLEQIISTISHNISDAYQALNTPAVKTSGHRFGSGHLLAGLKHKQDASQDSDSGAPKQQRASTRNARRSRRLKQLQNSKKNQQKQQRHRNANARKQIIESQEPLSGISEENWTAGVAVDQPPQQQQQQSANVVYRVQSSLFSSFYVKYNQFATKGIHVRLNEHQYRLTSTLATAVSNLASSVSKLVNLGGGSGVDLRRLGRRQRQQLRQERKLLRPIKFIQNLSRTTNKALIAVSFHTLAAFAQNSEDARRQVSDFTGVMAHILNCLDLASTASSTPNEDRIDQEQRTTAAGDSADEDDHDGDETSESSTESSEDDADEEPSESDDFFDMFDEMDDVENGGRHNVDLAAAESDDSACIMRFSALCLLHSLSRSVHQLRTKFLDQKIWHNLLELMRTARRESAAFLRPREVTELAQKPSQTRDEENDENEVTMAGMCIEMQKLSDSNNDDNEDEEERERAAGRSMALHDDESEQNLICILTAVFSNLLLDFSPSKDMMFESGIIRILVDLLEHRNLSVKVNCMWALMNMAFHAEQKVKQEILSTVTMEKLFQLLTEKDETLIMKTLGLLRNLISFRPHVDLIMTLYGTKIIQAMIMVLESELCNVRVKEQALTILVNVADGTVSKEFIMDNEDLLRKINSFMTANCVELQISAVCCVANLVLSTDDGAVERQTKLKDMGAHRILQKLLHATDSALLEKVKYALQQFSLTASASSLSLSGALGSSGGGVASSSSSSSSSTSINSASAT